MDEYKERLAIICKAECKTLDQVILKMKKAFDIVYAVLFISVILLVLLSSYYKSNSKFDEAYITRTIAIGLAIGLVILKLVVRFFPGSFNNKPTREEMEIKMFDEKENSE